MTPALLGALIEARAHRRPAVLATRLADGSQHLLVEPVGRGMVEMDPRLLGRGANRGPHRSERDRHAG